MEKRLHRFYTQAMRTDWSFMVWTHDRSLAEAACDEAFRDVAKIEEELSRFIPSSDIARLYHLKAGESMSVGLAAFDCLALAKDVWTATNGAFDVAIRPLYDLWQSRTAADFPSKEEIAFAREQGGSAFFELDEENFTVRVQRDHLRFDLGALGKGYALDMAAEILRDQYELHDFLLVTGSGSTVLAHGQAPEGGGWRVNAGVEGGEPVRLSNRAISASGFAYQGAHIIDPRSGYPVTMSKKRVWALAPTAVLSDALSTAFLVMEREEIQEFLKTQEGIEVIFPETVAPA